MIARRLKAAVYDRLPLTAKLAVKEIAFRLRGRPTNTGDREVVLVFDERLPTPDRDAGSLRMVRILSILTTRWRVIFLPFTASNEREQDLRSAGAEVADIGEYKRLLKSPRVVAAIVSRPAMAALLTPRFRQLNPGVRVIFDTVDVHFVRLERECALTADERICAEAARYREIETELARSVDVIWCASVDDERLLRNAVGDCESVVIPTLHEIRDAGTSFEEREGLLFVGSFAHRPNADAVEYFLREIFPLVREEIPGISFTGVGAGPPAEIIDTADERVRFPGYVPDMEPCLRTARLFIAPLRYGGAGTKGKVGEALACGLPVITTPCGAEGFGLTSGTDALIADGPREFANAIVRAYSDKELWSQLSGEGRRKIEDGFTPAAVAAKILASVDPSRPAGHETIIGLE